MKSENSSLYSQKTDISPALSQFNPVHTLEICFCKFHLTSILPVFQAGNATLSRIYCTYFCGAYYSFKILLLINHLHFTQFYIYVSLRLSYS
jgi:hypothetical protein